MVSEEEVRKQIREALDLATEVLKTPKEENSQAKEKVPAEEIPEMKGAPVAAEPDPVREEKPVVVTEPAAVAPPAAVPQQGKAKTTFLFRNWSWMLAAAVTAVFMLIFMIAARVSPFGSNSFNMIDSIHQYVPFFSVYQDKLKRGADFWYTWKVGGGQNFQSLLLYYMASPLNLVLLLCSRRHITAVMSLLIAGKIVFSAGAMGYYLSRRNVQRIVNTPVNAALSVCFSLSSYMMGYLWNLMWLDCITVFPLIILGYERLRQKSDPRMYTVALAYSLFCNYYISFMICLFLILWFFCTGHENGKKFLTDGLKFAVCSLLAAGIAALSLVMAYLGIRTTASADTPFPEWSWYQNIGELLKKQFFLSRPVNNNNFDGDANLYCGTLTVALVFIYFLSENISLQEKVRKGLLVAFLVVSMNAVPLNFIWHGFHDQYGIPNRFSFLYIFVLLVLAADAAEHLVQTGPLLITSGLLLTLAFYSMVAGSSDFSTYLPEFPTLLISVGLILIYGVFLILWGTRLMKQKTVSIVLSSILTLEILVNASLGVGSNGVCSAGYYQQDTEKMERAVTEVDRAASGKGEKLYRSDLINPRMLDEASYDLMNSLGTFCSTVSGDMTPAMAELGFYTGANEYLYSGQTPVANDILGVRYIYERTGDYFPGRGDLQKVYDKEDVKVYENEDALPIAYGVNGKLRTWISDKYNSAYVLNTFAGLAAGTPEIFRQQTGGYTAVGKSCTVSTDEENPNVLRYMTDGTGTPEITVSFAPPVDGRYFINIRGNYLKNITYYRNGQRMASDRYQTQMLDLGNLSTTDSISLRIEFSDGYTPSGNVILYRSLYQPEAEKQMVDTLARHGMKITASTDSSFSGSVTLGKGQYLFTSIPYDKGWKVEADGKELKTFRTVRGFLGVDPGEGSHEMTFRFRPPGLRQGSCISGISLLIFLLVWVVYDRKRKRVERRRNPD